MEEEKPKELVGSDNGDGARGKSSSKGILKRTISEFHVMILVLIKLYSHDLCHARYIIALQPVLQTCKWQGVHVKRTEFHALRLQCGHKFHYECLATWCAHTHRNTVPGTWCSFCRWCHRGRPSKPFSKHLKATCSMVFQ